MVHLKSVLCASILIATTQAFDLEKGMRHILKSEPVQKLFEPKGKTPIVEGFGYEGNLFTFLDFTFSYGFSLDAFLGYEAPLFYYSSGGNYMMLLPKLWAEGSTKNFVQFGTPDYNFKINFDFIGFKYAFAQGVYRQSIDAIASYCY